MAEINKCRMCSGDCGGEGGVSLLDPQHRSLANFIVVNFKFMISTGNGFPTRICANCISSINQWKIFQTHCKDSQVEFSSRVIKLKTNFRDPLLSPSENLIAAKFPDLKVASVALLKMRDIVTDGREKNKKKKCDICHRKYTYMRKHLRKHHRVSFEEILIQCGPCKVFVCDICRRQFPIKSQLQSHIGSHLLPFQCETCSKRYISQCSLTKHLLTHKERKFFCDKCNKKFTQIHHLRDHIESQHNRNIRKYKCNKCEMKFKCEFTLRKHEKYVHTTKNIKFPCDKCGKKFKFREYLKLHQRNVHVEAKFICKFCSFAFKRKSHLVRHLKKQHETFFKCDHCDLKFNFRIALSKHVKNIHESVNNIWKCTKCNNKCFEFQFQLARHMESVHAVSLWVYCSYCRKKFVDKCDLQFHIKKYHLK